MHPKIYTILQVCLLSLTGYSQTAFVTVWNSENAGSSQNNQIVIPGEGTDYDIAWELVADPMVNGTLTGNDNTTVTFPGPGIYRVSITPGSGTFHRMFFNGLGDSQKLVTIEQWGDIQWSSMNNAFAGCSQMNCTAMDAPDLTNVTDLSYMFLSCDLFNGQIGSWDVSGVTRMSCMFNYAYAFNQDIGSWDVSAVTDMDSMFLYATSFNQNIWFWDVSNVTSMRFMFMNATSFNQPLGNWSVPNVLDMSGMFSGATSFNQYLGSWGLNPLVDVQEMLNNCGISCENYDITLQFWSLEPGTPDNLVLGAAGRTYWLSGASRDNLISAKGWIITGDTFEECEYGSLVCNNVEMMLSQDDFTNGIYLLPAASLVDNATGYEVYVKRLYSSCIDFDWTTEGACIDSDPNGIIDDFDLGLEHRACLPIALCDTEIDYEVRFVDPILGNWVFYCSGTLTIDLQAPIPGCTLPFAHNYNPLAETDDGSCETCIDGIQNGDETSIDCGGTLCPPCEICELPDRDAMIALYHAFNGQNWGFPWDTTACYCEWQGVVCDETDRVKELELTSVLGLSGYVPIEIGNLSNLERLYLRQLPDLTDTLPASLGNLTALNVLEIIDCNITGQIPASLGNLSNLWEFRLDENSLSGALPAELAGIMNPLLHTLRLNDNTLSGCFPNEYHVFCTAQLVYKEFYNNSGLPNNGDFSAFCQTGAGSCETCDDGLLNGDEEGIDCGGLFCEPCECTLPDYDALVAFYLATDGANWTIPWDTTDCNYCTWYGVECSMNNRVSSLLLLNNGLSGYIPPEIGDLTALNQLYLTHNDLSGPLPDALGQLTNLSLMRIAGCDLSGPIPESIGNLTNLHVLELTSNALEGEIPASLGNLNQMHIFTLADNLLTGELPVALANMNNPGLQTFWLHDNLLTGCFPEGYNVFCDLPSVDFTDNAGLPGGGDFDAFCDYGANCSLASCDDGLLNGDEAGIDCGGSCSPCPPPTAACGVITVFVDPGNPEFDGPGNNNIWWIPADLLDAGSVSAYELPTTSVKRYLSNITFDWTTNGACIDATPNGGSLSNADKGTIYRPCLPVRTADFNTWKLYQFQISDPAGTDGCSGMVRVVPQSGMLSTVIHYSIPEAESEQTVPYTLADNERSQSVGLQDVALMPNPGSDWLTIHWESERSTKTEINIFDCTGRVLKYLTVDSSKGRNLVEIDMADQPGGFYIIQIRNPEPQWTLKWIKNDLRNSTK